MQFVRNHGSVPQIQWGAHRITIDGLVDRPVTLTMDELVALPSVTFPVTLVCAGNRRKEENMVSCTQDRQTVHAAPWRIRPVYAATSRPHQLLLCWS